MSASWGPSCPSSSSAPFLPPRPPQKGPANWGLLMNINTPAPSWGQGRSGDNIESHNLHWIPQFPNRTKLQILNGLFGLMTHHFGVGAIFLSHLPHQPISPSCCFLLSHPNKPLTHDPYLKMWEELKLGQRPSSPSILVSTDSDLICLGDFQMDLLGKWQFQASGCAF